MSAAPQAQTRRTVKHLLDPRFREARLRTRDRREIARTSTATPPWAIGSPSGCSLRRDAWRPQTWRAYNLYVQHHIVPAIGDVPIHALTAEHIDQLHTTMLRTVSATTTRHAHDVLASALRAATRRGLRVSSAIRDVPPPRRSSPLIEPLTRDEVTRLINTAYGDALEAAYVLAATLGMRQGELRGLRWSARTSWRRCSGMLPSPPRLGCMRSSPMSVLTRSRRRSIPAITPVSISGS